MSLDAGRLEDAIDAAIAALDPNYADSDTRTSIKETWIRPWAEEIVTEIDNNFSGGGGGSVSSVFGRTGAVTALQADYDAFFTTPAEVATLIATHAGLADPHPGYLTQTEADALYDPLGAGGVSSFNGRTGAVSPLAADYDGFFLTPAEGNAAYDAIGAAAAAQAASQPLDADLTAIAALGTTGWAQRTGANTWALTTPTASDVGAVPTGRTITATAPARIDGGASADLSSNRTISVSAATTSAAGVVELATDGEAIADRAVQGDDNRLFQATLGLLLGC